MPKKSKAKTVKHDAYAIADYSEKAFLFHGTSYCRNQCIAAFCRDMDTENLDLPAYNYNRALNPRTRAAWAKQKKMGRRCIRVLVISKERK